MRRFLTGLVILGACGPGLPGGADGSGSTGVDASSSAPTSGAAEVSTGGSSSAASESSAGSSGGSTAESGGADDTLVLSMDIGTVQCNPFTQDCPEGYKCAPYADDGGTSWNNDKCVPVMEDPAQVHEPCFAEGGGLSGIDNCDLGLLCWDVDAEDMGHCVALCTGSAEAGICEEPGYVCAVSGSGVIPLCLESCDPLAQDCEEQTDVCIGNPMGQGFLCVLDVSGDEGQAHDSCDFANDCDPGLLCNAPTAAVECDPNANGCCEPFCDLSGPNAGLKCPGEGQVCNPYFEEEMALPGYENGLIRTICGSYSCLLGQGNTRLGRLEAG